MKIKLQDVEALLSSYNARGEVHGDERQAAADIRFEVNVPNDALSQLSPTLKASLYTLDKEHADLADQGSAGETGYLPHLKNPQLGAGKALQWDGEMPSATVTVKPEGRSEITLKEVKVNAVTLMPQQGGTVVISFRVQLHPDEKQAGRLSTLVQQTVVVSVEPDEEKQPALT